MAWKVNSRGSSIESNYLFRALGGWDNTLKPGEVWRQIKKIHRKHSRATLAELKELYPDPFPGKTVRELCRMYYHEMHQPL